MLMCLISGLSKWVRQLVHHHDTFSNAMQSLVAFSQGQQKVKVVPVDSHTSRLTVSSPEGHLPLTVEGTCLPKASEPLTLDSYIETPKQDERPSAHVISPVHIKDKQNEKGGESKCWIQIFFFFFINTNLALVMGEICSNGKTIVSFYNLLCCFVYGYFKISGWWNSFFFFLIAYCLKHHDQYQDKEFYWKTNLRQTQSQWRVTVLHHLF